MPASANVYHRKYHGVDVACVVEVVSSTGAMLCPGIAVQSPFASWHEPIGQSGTQALLPYAHTLPGGQLVEQSSRQ